MALGALPGDVLRMIFLDAGAMVGCGMAVGLAGAVALGRYAESQLFGITPSDPLILASAAGLLIVVALTASFVPGRRASRIDPVAALRCE